MRTISLKEFETLIDNCLSNPDDFRNRTIVLWNSHNGPDSIEYRMIERKCDTYNQNNQDNEIRFENQLTLNPSRVDYANNFGIIRRGIFLDDGSISFLRPSEDQVSDWLNFVNTRYLDGEELSNDYVLIACARPDCYPIKESDFGSNCEVLYIHPTVDEWAVFLQEDGYDNVILEPIVSFIKQCVEVDDFFGWNIAVRVLSDYMGREGLDTLSQIPEIDFDEELRSSLAYKVVGFPYKELWEFIQNYKK